ncbi:metallophosphoesterase [Paenibacillus sp. CF384]|uniref:metallophosphoesterase family protein n=1 Tax=Paenibacillus sp. CF384 TaxID=1884382 RepID=UPI00089C6646|nr:metallophosphoesterase [Paenibacillus sp. CF384]SDW71626.1 Calcineurin-like phosphoesterase [Paenibacillus sp. CF384]
MRLILMGDLHYHDIEELIPGLAAARTAFYHTLLGRFMNTVGDWHISLGDLTNVGSPSELQGVYELLQHEKQGRRFIHVLGNHDLYLLPREQVLEMTGQKRYHAIDTDEAMLVFLDTARELDITDWSGWVDEEQLRWLEACVERSGSKPLLVFGHHPVYRTTSRSEMHNESIHPSIDMWRILSRKKQGIGVYFNGHTHVNSIVSQSNWTFVQLAACLDHPEFRIVEVEGEHIRISTVDVADEGMMDHADLMHKYMPFFDPNPDGRGQNADRHHVISLWTSAAVQPL